MKKNFFCVSNLNPASPFGSEKVMPLKLPSSGAQRPQIRKKSQILGGTLILVLLFSFLSTPLFSDEKKLRVISEKANIYLDPDRHSPVVETVIRGTVLSLNYSGRIRKIWNYIYFTSPQGITKSGYILDSLVERLFIPTKILTLVGKKEKPQEAIDSYNIACLTFWGMKKETLLKKAGPPSRRERSRELDIFEYRQRIYGKDCLIDYIFVRNELASAKYNFIKQHMNKNFHIEDYKKIREVLAQKYGKPESDHVNWSDELYREDSSKWGLAVSLGHMECQSYWQTPETEIVLTLMGDNNEISLEVEYVGVKQKGLLKKIEDKAAL
jgi:hypothetical protein